MSLPPPYNSPPSRAGSRVQLLNSLRQKIQHCETLHHGETETVLSSGCPQLDAELPAGGFRKGSVVEWLAGHPGSGARLWALNAALHATGHQAADHQAADHHGLAHDLAAATTTSGRAIVVIDPSRTFYPPAAAALGIDLRRLIIVQPHHATDAMWAIDQTLRCPAVAAVCAPLDRLDPRDGRRLQLAAEEGGSLGLFLRPLTARGKPSWSDVQILVQPQLADTRGNRRWRLTLLRCRGTKPGTTICVPLNPTSQTYETSPLYLAAQLARPAADRRSARA